MRAIAILSILFLAVFPNISWAALTPISLAKNITPDRAWNPCPESDDFMLPMPCNGQLALRLVAIPKKTGILDDLKFSMGINSGANTERDIYERRFEGNVSAPFTVYDLPEAWRKVLEQQPDADSFFYFFIAKYELSTWQWRLVMDDSCPSDDLTLDDLRPKTNISWYDMQNFLGKYMQWLLQNNANALPIFADNNKDRGFLRLPTEEEWEFAARGGLSVPEEHRSQEDFYPLEEYAGPQKGDNAAKLKKGDFAIYQSGDRIYREAEPIGSRKPNPLLIYDMAGNASELVQSTFRFRIAEQQSNMVVRRLHGSAGGLVTKGGSFLSKGESSILPGARDEAPLFRADSIYSMRDLGFRPVLSGINTPAGRRETEIGEASRTPTIPEPSKPPSNPEPEPGNEDTPVEIDLSGSLLSELDKIITATSSDMVKDNLAQYRSMVTDNLSAANRLRGEISMNLVRFALFEAEAIVNIAYRIRKTERDHQDAKDAGQKLTGPQIEEYKTFMNGLKDIFVSSINRYRQNLEAFSKESPDELNGYFSVIRKEYAGAGLLNNHMRQNLNALEKHIPLVRKNGIGFLSKKQLAKDIVPEVLMPTFDF